MRPALLMCCTAALAAILLAVTALDAAPAPPGPELPAACANLVDDDGDGAVDLDDPGCADKRDQDETDPPLPPPQPACGNGIDDDGDGAIDGLDPGCSDTITDNDETDPPPLPVACANGIDDDGDGAVDLDDPGCDGPIDTSEDDPLPRPACADRADNDADGRIDGDDPGCDGSDDDDETDPKPDKPPRGGAPLAAFEVAPARPLTGETVLFTARAAAAKNRKVVALRWDLDGDGAYDDATGGQASRTFPRPGESVVGLEVEDDDGTTSVATRRIAVQNRAPAASFQLKPQAPVAGERVRFVSTAQDPDGTLAAVAWDLDGDGAYDDGTGAVAARRYRSAGRHVVRLRVTDAEGAQAMAQSAIDVSKPSPITPFPVIRLAGRYTHSGVTVRLLSVMAPRGARTVVRCVGGRCPVRSQARTSRLSRFRRFERGLPPGVKLEIRVTQRGRMGKYTSFRIRSGRPPLRRDRCIAPWTTRPRRCRA
jgi:PKD repeat protein